MSSEFKWLDPESIEPLENLRATVDQEEYESLRADIHHRGIKENVSVRPHPDGIVGHYQVYGGRLRTRIALEAKINNRGLDDANGNPRTWKEAPIMVPALIKDVSDYEAYAFTWSENVNRINIDDYAKGTWLRLMSLKFKADKTQLAKSMGRSVAYISRLIAFANSVDVNGATTIPASEREYRVFRKLTFEQQESIRKKVADGGVYPSVRAMERMMKAKKTAEAILKEYDPLTADDEFIKYLLMSEAGLTIIEAKEEIQRWRRGVKIEIKDETPDQRYLKMTKFYPLEIIQEVSDDAEGEPPLDKLAMRGRMLIRALWLSVPEAERRKVIDEWKLKKTKKETTPAS